MLFILHSLAFYRASIGLELQSETSDFGHMVDKVIVL